MFKELTRVRQYFEKIKALETGPENEKPNLTLNKEAAARFIKHGLVSSIPLRGAFVLNLLAKANSSGRK